MPEFSTASIIFVVTIVLNVAIASFVYANKPKSATNILFFLLNLSISAWLISMLATRSPVLNPWHLYLVRSTLVLATIMNMFFYFFARTVPDDKFGVTRRSAAVIIGLVGCVIALSVSPLVFSEIKWGDSAPEPVTGPALPIFGIFQTILNFGAIFSLFFKARKAHDERRFQLRLVIFGIFLMIGLVTGTIFVPVLLLGDSSFVAISPLYVLVFSGLVGFAIFRKGFLDVKVVSAEVFSAVLMFISAAQLFQSASIIDFIFRSLMLIAVGVIAVLFIKSIRDEVRQREELSRLSKDLAEANKHLKEMDQLKSEFISIASHQLRTPISVVKGYLSLMLDGAYGALNDSLKTKVEQVLEMNERLVLMVSNMLNVTRIEKHRLEFVCETADVARIINDGVEEMHFKAGQKGIGLRFADAPSDPLVAYVDKEKVHEMLTNLIDNAIKYSQKGEIIVRAVPHRKGKEVLVSVQDTGVGMTKQESSKLFEKFFRAGAGQITHEQGTGLGLYVCKMFVEGMGGKIWIDRSEPGMGTTFAFVLPTVPKQECAEPRKKPVSST